MIKNIGGENIKKIDGSKKSLKQLRLNIKYRIHYYQREYR